MDPLTISDITQLISNVGFPIAAFAAIFYLYNKTITKLVSTLEKVENALEKLESKV